MNLYQIQTAKVGGMYSEHTDEQQCRHDIMLDDLIEIGPVVKNTIGNKASLMLVYNRQHNPRISIHFELFSLACQEREKLVAEWREYQTNINSLDVVSLDAPNGLMSIDLKGLRAAAPSDNGAVLVYSDGSVELAIQLGVDRDTLLQKINAYLNRGNK